MNKILSKFEVLLQKKHIKKVKFAEFPCVISQVGICVYGI